MARAVEGRWTLQDRVTPAIQRMNRETMEYRATVREARASISSDWEHLKTGVMVASAAVAGGILAIGAFAKSAADEAKDGIEASTKLTSVLHNVKGVTDDQIQGLQDYASALKDIGVVDDDVQVAGIQQLGTFQLQASTIKTLMPGMADLVAQQKGLNATQEDAVNIGNLVGKAMTGQIGALSRVGISFSAAQEQTLKYGTQSQRAAVLAAVLQQNVGGVNKALAQTDLGKILKVSMAISDMKKEMGNVVLSIEGKLADAFMKNLPQIQTAVDNISNSIADWANSGGVDRVINRIESMGKTIKDVYNDASAVYSYFRDNWSLIGPIVYTAIGSFIALRIAIDTAKASVILFGKESLIAGIYTNLIGTYALVTAGELSIFGGAVRLLNAAWKANPIGLVILGLTILVGVITYARNNWENLRLTWMKVCNSILDTTQWAVNELVDFGNFIIKIFSYAWDNVKYNGISLWNDVVDSAQGAINKAIDFANMYIKVYKFAWDSIKYAGISLWNDVVDSAQGGLQKLLTPINAIREAIGKDAIALNFSDVKFNVQKPTWDSSVNVIPKVDFSAVKGAAQKPTWDSSLNVIPKVDFSGAKYTQDDIMAQTVKAQQERNKNNNDQMKALTDAVKQNTDATNNNTDGTNGLSGTLKNGVSVNMTAEQVADSLVPRLERHLYGTA